MQHEITLSFGISGFDDISHDELTSIVGIHPDIIFVKDKQTSDPSRKNAWIMSPDVIRYAPFDQQMDYFLNLLETKIDVFKSLSEKYSCAFSCEVVASADSEDRIPPVRLNERYHKLSKDVNLTFDMALNCWPEGD